MAKSYRKERINERIKELLGELILSRIKDPRIGLVSITSVKVAPDLSTAKVYFTVMGDEETRKETREGLKSAKSFLRKTIGRDLKIRQAPDLRFVYDDSLDRAMRIEEAIGRIRNESDTETETVDDVGEDSDVTKDAGNTRPLAGEASDVAKDADDTRPPAGSKNE